MTWIAEIVGKGTPSDQLLLATLGLYLVSLLVCLARPALTRWPMLLGVLAHLTAMVWRGALIDAFPLTNKLESFSSASLALALVCVIAPWPRRCYLVPMIALAILALGTALCFPLALNHPPPLMQTIWYPLHVPLSFMAYALWAGAAAAGLCWALQREHIWLRRVDHLALLGFGLWSLGMVFGGIWGVLAWGAYFLWDPKVIWSVVLWFHYAAFVHIRLTPSLFGKLWLRPVLAVLGLFWVLVTYVGTSFFFGRSSHGF